MTPFDAFKVAKTLRVLGLLGTYVVMKCIEYFDTFEPTKLVIRGLRDPRYIDCHEMHQKGS